LGCIGRLAFSTSATATLGGVGGLVALGCGLLFFFGEGGRWVVLLDGSVNGDDLGGRLRRYGCGSIGAQVDFADGIGFLDARVVKDSDFFFSDLDRRNLSGALDCRDALPTSGHGFAAADTAGVFVGQAAHEASTHPGHVFRVEGPSLIFHHPDGDGSGLPPAGLATRLPCAGTAAPQNTGPHA